MGRFSDAERHEATGMISAGLSDGAVSRRFRYFHKTRNLDIRNEETGSVVDRQSSGRQRVTTRQQDRHIALIHLRDCFTSVVQTARETP